MQRLKFWCQPCDYVTKARRSATCPRCKEPMRNMGSKWRVGRKGHREDWQRHDLPPAWLLYGPHRERMKMLGKIIYDPRRGEYVYEATYRRRNK